MQRSALGMGIGLMSACTAPTDLPRTFTEVAAQATIVSGPLDAVELRPLARLRRPDGRYDLLLSHARTNGSLYRWDASKPDEAPVRLKAAYPTTGPLRILDVDQDGWEDLAFGPLNHVEVFRGPLSPSQLPSETWFELPIGSGFIDGLDFRDVTGDGEPDWMFALNRYPEEGLIILPGPVTERSPSLTDGAIILQPHPDSAFGAGIPVIGDLTGDGVVDVIPSETPWLQHLHPGPLSADGAEPTKLFVQTEGAGRDFKVQPPWDIADVTGDGQPDLLARLQGIESRPEQAWAGGLAIWEGPLSESWSLEAPDRYVIGGPTPEPDSRRRESWKPAALADLDGDGTAEVIHYSHAVGNLIHEDCVPPFVSGALAWTDDLPDGETVIAQEHGLFVGGPELGRLRGVFNVGDLDGTGRDVLAVGLPLLNAELTCPSNDARTGLDYVLGGATGGFALLRLPE